MRSRAVRRPFLCCDSMAFAPPPTRICSSSFLMVVSKSTARRAFLSNSSANRKSPEFDKNENRRRDGRSYRIPETYDWHWFSGPNLTREVLTHKQAMKKSRSGKIENRV